MSIDEPVVVARVARAHGINGGLLLEAETDYAEALFQPGRRLRVVPGARAAVRPAVDSLTLTSAQPHARRWLVATEELGDRTSAETLRGAELTVPRDALPDLDAGGYLLHDLIGMTVFAGGQPLGVIEDVYEQPGAPLLGVMVEGRERLIPFQEGVVDEVSLDSGEVRVTLPAGLLDI